MNRYNLISSDEVSVASLYIAHGLSWGKHRYVKREGSAGHYTYIYPEDLKARRESRNEAGATLFGDKYRRQWAISAKQQVKKLKRAETKANKNAEKATLKAIKLSTQLNDPSLSKRQRAKLSKRATDANVKAQVQRALATKISQARLSAEEDARTKQFYYDRTRKIDDIPANIADLGKAFIGSIHRTVSKVVKTEKKVSKPKSIKTDFGQKASRSFKDYFTTGVIRPTPIKTRFGNKASDSFKSYFSNKRNG